MKRVQLQTQTCQGLYSLRSSTGCKTRLLVATLQKTHEGNDSEVSSAGVDGDNAKMSVPDTV